MPPTPDITKLDSLTLYYRSGAADKVYTATIVPAGDGLFTVAFAFGRRGTTLQAGTKTSAPVPYARARAVFERLVAEKTAKGYTPGDDGVPYQNTPRAARHTGIDCQLLNAIDEAALPRYLDSARHAMQEKHDGRRMLARKDGLNITGINRLGLTVALPLPVAEAVGRLPCDCVLDGEAVGDVLHVFDILQAGDADLRGQPYIQRLAELARLAMPACCDSLRLVSTALSAADKAALFERLKRDGREGVVFKDLNAPYTAGRPASGGAQLKFKFRDTATCVVTALNEKRSVGIGLFANRKLVACGNVAIPPDQPVPEIGWPVEVRYLYAFPESHVLFQPVYLSVRSDARVDDCVLGQLRYKAS
jgi:bifunctional non-homologous end joining protein LigD